MAHCFAHNTAQQCSLVAAQCSAEWIAFGATVVRTVQPAILTPEHTAHCTAF